MTCRGLPAELEEPMRWLFERTLPARAREIRDRLEARREVIARSAAAYAFTAPARTSGARWLVRQENGEITSRRLARSVSVPARWGVFLHLCAESFRPTTVLELGTCVGLSGAYLAAASSSPHLLTLDGSADLGAVARETLSLVTTRAEVVVGPFHETLGSAVGALSVDLAYIDGHHDGEATRRYVDAVLPRLSPHSLVVLDDIRLHAQMWSAWQDVASRDGVVAAVDVGRFGLLVWDQRMTDPQHFDLARFTGWWPVPR